MATIKILSIRPEINRGGWDVTIQLSNVLKTQNKTFYWPQKDKPNNKILKDKFKYFSDQFDVVEPEPEKNYSETEINTILKEKKYFTNGNKFPDDLPDKSDVLKVVK